MDGPVMLVLLDLRSSQVGNFISQFPTFSFLWSYGIGHREHTE